MSMPRLWWNFYSFFCAELLGYNTEILDCAAVTPLYPDPSVYTDTTPRDAALLKLSYRPSDTHNMAVVAK